MVVHRELTMKDMEGIEVKGNHPLDVLVAVAARAEEILEAQEEVARKRKSRSQTKVDLSAKSIPIKKTRSLPQEFKKAIQAMAEGRNVSRETLVIEKELSSTDLSAHHSRLSIPTRQIKRDFLTEEEKDYLCTRDGRNHTNYIEVKVIKPSLERGLVNLRKWEMKKKDGVGSSSYVITGRTWKDIATEDGLNAGMVMQIWAFRIQDELCFALVRLPCLGNKGKGPA